MEGTPAVRIPENFPWSFSKLEAYAHCPRMFALKHLQGFRGDTNAFSEYGCLCHKLLEEYAKGALEDFELASEYEKRYDSAIRHFFPSFPKGYALKAYRQGLAYMENFTGFGENNAILAVEDKFDIPVGGERFLGIADLVLQDKSTGQITVVDHKTKSPASMKRSMPTFRHQLYLYAAYVKHTFGVYPAFLAFNMIKSREMLVEPFQERRFRETLAWIASTIASIRSETLWPMHPSDYFCSFICDMADHCQRFQACPDVCAP